jgi:hypothetical protein
MHIRKKHHHSKHKKKAKNPSDPTCASDGWCGESLWPAGRAKESEHAVLRKDTDIGANQAPSKEEKSKNEWKAIKARPDPHPHTDEPISKEELARRAAMKAAQPPLPDTSANRHESSLLKDAEWEATHGSSKAQKQSLASVKSSHKMRGVDESGPGAPLDNLE